MNPNPYAPPTAAVADLEHLSIPSTAPPFFAVSTAKLVIMCIATGTLYEVYWFYRNWWRIRERGGIDVFPFTRAILSPFYCYQCFACIRDEQTAVPVTPGLAAGPLAAGFILSTLLFVLPEPFDLLSMLSFVFLVPVQAYVNRLNAAAVPSHDRNDRLTAWNWVALPVGVFLWSLVLASYMMGER